MKNTKIIICLILSITLGIAAAAPLINAELIIRPWITTVQGPTAPFTFEVVYANFTITDPDAPTRPLNTEYYGIERYRSGTTTGSSLRNSVSRIDYDVVINVTNPSEYRAILGMISLFTAQEIHETTAQSIRDLFGPSTSGRGIEAKGAWVDDVYYNVTCTIPWPCIDENGVVFGDWGDRINSATTTKWNFRDTTGNVRTSENSTIEEYRADWYSHYYQWIEGVQGYEYSINDGTSTTKYTYLNIDGTWVDVTGRVTFDKEPESEPERSVYSSTGGFASQVVHYVGTGSQVSKENEYDCFFAPGESRLLIISGSVNVESPIPEVSESYFNPVDIIQSCIVQTLIQSTTFADIEFDMEAYFENHTFISTITETADIQELVLTQVGNSYIYNTVLPNGQMFEFDQYGLEVFIVPVR
jgi:hypothetical protein